MKCEIGDCPKAPTRSKGTLCEMHYCRIRRGIPLDKPAQARRLEGHVCFVEECSKPRTNGRYCAMHEARIRRHGDADAWHPKPSKPGAQSSNWSGESASYNAAHLRLKSVRGKPLRCDQCGVTGEGRQYHWALNWNGQPKVRAEIVGPIHTRGVPYSTDPLDYSRLCVPCHKRMDLASIPSRFVTTHPLEARAEGLRK